ncbi:CGMP-dependent kinase 9-1 (macronuclear) [Tetrahymena thermophila SB210]|uniref:cGMP-dependent protein kinase n=1 Tax=Tetrahymena thermophila (strain SB210) TaxID=312017 RepID=Q234E6_TETTS|nr:CGMP-dependent kinase 9-1 [Tetrahymena thermophila SB210]EAR92057.2 CGMP-dependent kinase 9-1 [Tetrahymena thermophila SB210]|eukprot:XP_001012302.2 CGMP-dependent kinase 9-1 [Tetrahymena thermophila SB210]
MEDKKIALQSYKDLRVELNKNPNNPSTPLDKRRGNKRAAIKNEFSMEIEICENFKRVEKKKNYQDIKFIITCLRNHFVFYNLQDSQLETLVNEMFYCELQEGETIIKEEDNASTFFILEQGRIQVSVKDNVKRDIVPGEGFGELALLYNAPRSASCKALQKCHLWGIDRATFRRVVEEMITKEYEQNRKFIENHKFFQNLTVEQKNSVAGVLIDQKFQKDQIIVSEDDPASSFYIIKEGSVSVMRGGAEVRTLQGGDSFGETALLQGVHKRAMTVKAQSDVKCLALGRDVLTRILGDQVEVIIYKNISKWSLERLEGYQGFTKSQKEKLLDNIQINHHKDGEVVIQQGTPIKNAIIILLEGQIKKGNDVVAQKGHVFGDKEPFMQNDKSVYPNNLVIFGEQCITGSIKIEKLVNLFGESPFDVINKNKQVKEQSAIEESNLKSQVNNMKLSDLIVIKKLGFGQFGSVFLVKEKGKKKLYGLKCVSKAQVVEQSLEKHIQNEKQVMEFNNFPFVMKFLRSFKDDRCIYFLLEFIQGMELFDVIREIGLLSTYDSQFYIGSLILTLEYLHSNYIIYRDIKPENIMVDHAGYLKLIDMGTAKIMKSKAGTVTRTFTIIGTPHYMAPEVISGKGYNFLVDLWSVGICLYEFMCGYVPFAEEAEDPYEIYEEIIKKEIQFPAYMKDAVAKQLMLQLLNKIPEIRLGGSYNALKSNAWFKNFDWHQLLERKLKAPWIPPEESQLKEEKIAQIEKQGIIISEQVKAEGINPVQVAKIKNPKYDPRWEDIF